MKVHCLTVGLLETNAYIVEDGKHAVIVDPGDDSPRFVDFLNRNKLRPLAILLTHGHGDHIGAVGTLKKAYPKIPVLCHKLDAPMLCDSSLNLANQLGIDLNVGKADRFIGDADEVDFEGIRFEVRHVPGHTAGHVVFVFEGNVIAGDTVFAGGIGRWDLPGGDGESLISSIRQKILSLPDETKIWPGHGPWTTVGEERRTNPYLDPKFNPNTVWW